MYRIAFALAAATLSLTTAHAADIKTIGCVVETTDAETLRLLDADIERNLNNAGGQQSYAPAVVQKLQAAAAACKARYGWSAEATQAALIYSIPVRGAPIGRRLAAANKLDYSKIERRLMALPNAERVNAMDPAILNKIAEAAVGAGEVVNDNSLLAGGILGLLAVREKALNDFGLN